MNQPFTVKCFCCGKEHEVKWSDDNQWTYPHVHGGMWFQSSGGYGSGIFDPIAPLIGGCEYLRIFICDDCVVAKKDIVTHIYKVIEGRTTAKSKSFDPSFNPAVDPDPNGRL